MQFSRHKSLSAFHGVCLADIYCPNTAVRTLCRRNDELCVLYERAHVQEAQLAKGVVELQQKENEIRVLQLEVAELARSITATTRSLPNVEGIDREVAALKVWWGGMAVKPGSLSLCDSAWRNYCRLIGASMLSWPGSVAAVMRSSHGSMDQGCTARQIGGLVEVL